MNTTILIIAALLVVAGILIVLMNRLRRNADGTDNEVKICETTGEVCCGGGADCHKYSSSKKTNPIPYFEDEELDRFRGKSPSDYSGSEVEEWRRVVETLKPHEVTGWVTSIHRRELHIPDELRAMIKSRMATSPEV